jgi:protein-disulfide isomerase
MDDGTLTKKEKRALAKEEKQKKREQDQKSSMLKKFLVWGLILIALAFGGYKVWEWINTPTETVDESQLLEVTQSDWIKGNPDASITFIEYGDFQCPACGDTFLLVKRLAEEAGEQVRVIYRHLPLVSIHEHALQAAKAAEAAGKQGKFWEMHDKLFENQDTWSEMGSIDEELNKYAGEIGLDVEQFKSDLESSDVADQVNADIFSANRLRLSSTPTFFLNGEEIRIPTDIDELLKLVLEPQQ